MTHDTVLVFSKTWGAIYLFLFFLIAVLWTYWPTRKKTLDRAAQRPLDPEDTPCR